MSSIDERIVEMQFNNKEFESGINTSIKSLDKLEKSLKLEGASDGLSTVSDTIKKLTFSNAINGASSVKKGIVGIAAELATVTQLTNAFYTAMNNVKSVVNSLTLEPISTGFSEYELKMGSVQTIMSATGESLDTVMDKLNELNLYADRTIYSFSDMTTNIGKFTNAGVDLDTAVAAMKGISNEAAVSGANANEASRAMYNLAQSLSMGYVQYIDWKSIENANMATVDFKQNLADMAVQLGTITQSSDEAGEAVYTLGDKTYSLQQLFKDAMSDKWLTNDVLLGTLAEYSDETTELGKKAYAAAQDIKTFSQLIDTLKEAAQSGWAESWEYIIGDFEQAKTTLTKINELVSGVIDAQAKARNNLLKGALHEYSPDDLTVTSSTWNDKLAGEDSSTINKLKSSLIQAAEAAGTLTKTETGLYQTLNGTTISATSFINTLDEGWLTANVWTNALESITSGSENATKSINNLQDAVIGIIRGDYGNDWSGRTSSLLEAGYSEADIENMQKVVNALSKEFGGFSNVTADQIIEAMSNLDDETLKTLGVTSEEVEALKELVSTSDGIQAVTDAMQAPSGYELLWESLTNIWTSAASILGQISSAFKDIFPPITAEQLYNIIDGFHSFTESLLPTGENLLHLRQTFKGIFSVFDIFGMAIMSVVSSIGDFTSSIDGSGIISKILSFTASIGNNVYILRNWIKENNVFGDAISFLSDKLSNIFSMVGSFFSNLGIFDSFNKKIQFASILLKVWWDRGHDLTTLLPTLKSILINTFGINFDYFINFISKIGNFLKPLINQFKIFGIQWKAWWTNGRSIEQFLKILKFQTGKIETFFKKIGSATINFFKNIDWESAKNNIKKGFDNVIDFLSSFAEKIGLGSIFSKIKAKLANISVAILDFILDVSNDINKFIQNILSNDGKSILEKVSEFCSNIYEHLKKMLGVIFDKGIIGTLKNIFSAISHVVSNLFSSVFKTDTGKIASFAIAIFGLITAFKFFANIISKIKNGGLFTLVENYTNSIIKQNNAKAFKDRAEGIFLMAVSIGILAASLLVLSTIPAGKLLISAGVLVAIFAVLALAPVLINKFGNISADDFTKLSSGIKNMSIALIAIAGAIWILSNINTQNIATKIGVLVVVLISLGLFAFAMSKIEKTDISGSGSVLKLAISLIIVAYAISIISNIGITDCAKAIIVIGFLMVVTGYIAKWIAESDSSGIKGNGKDVGTTMISLAASILIMAIAIGMIANQSITDCAKAIIVIGILMVVTGYIAKRIAKSDSSGIKGNGKDVGITMISLAASILIMAIAIGMIGSMPTETLEKAIVTISILMIVMGIIGKLLTTNFGNSTNGSGVATTLLSMAASILILAIAMYLIAGINTKDLNKAVLAITELEIVMAVVAKVANKNSGSKASMLLLIGCIAVLALILYALSTLPQDNLSSAANQLIKMAVVLKLLGSAFKTISALNVGSCASGALALMAGIGVIAGIIIAVAVIYELLCQIPGLKNFLMDALDDLSELMYKVGEVIGSIIGGIIDGATGDAISDNTETQTFSEKFTEFFTCITDAINSIQSIDESAFDKLESIGKFAVALGEAEIFDALSGLINKFSGENMGLDTFGEKIKKFGESMKSFAEDVADYDDTDVETVTNAGKALSELQNSLPDYGGTLQDWLGSTETLDEFSEGIKKFYGAMAEAVSAFQNEDGSSVDTSAISSAADIGQSLADLQNSLGTEDGILDWFVGKKSTFEDFGPAIKEFGSGMKSFYDSVGTTFASKKNFKSAKNAVKIGEALSGLKDTISNITGIAGLFADNSLDNFGDELGKFGEGLANFATAVSDTDFGDVSETTTGIIDLASALGAFNDTSLVDGIVYGINHLSSDFDQIQLLLDGISGLDISSSQEVITSLSELGSFMTAFGDNTGVSIDTSAADQISSMISSLNELTLDTDIIEQLGELFSSLTDENIDVSSGETIMEGFISKMSSTVNSDTTVIAAIVAMLTEVCNNGLNIIENYESNFRNSGSKLGYALCAGIRVGVLGLSSALTSALGSAIRTVDNYYNSFKSSGMYIAMGLKQGFTDYVYNTLIPAMRKAIKDAKDNFDDEADIDSPSKLFAESGKWIALGVAKGMHDNTSEIVKTSSEMVSSAYQSAKTSLSDFASLVIDDTVTDPVIRPVLDLSNVEDGAGTISSMFNSQSLSIGSASIDKLTAASAGIQNGINMRASLVGSIGDLKNALSNAGTTNTYNVNGVTYDDGTNIATAVKSLVRASKIERRI